MWRFSGLGQSKDSGRLLFSSVAQPCPTLCDPMDCSMPGFPAHHKLPELAQTHVYRVGDIIQPSHPLSSPSPPAFNLSQHQGLFQWKDHWLFPSGGQSIRASASVLPMDIQGWFPLGLTGLISLQSKGLSRAFSNTTVWKNQFFSAQPSLWSNLVHTSFSVLSKPNSAYAYLKLFFFFHSQTQLLVLPSTQALTFFHIHYKPLRFKDSVCAYACSIMFYSLWPHGL